MNERRAGILISYLNIVLHAVIGFAYVPLLLYYIGQSEYGLYQLIGSLIAYFSIMDFGLSAVVVRFYAKYKAKQDKLNMENILAIALCAYGFITFMLLVAGCIIYQYLPDIFSSSMTLAELATARSLFIMLLFNIALTISTMLFRAVINAHERFLFLKVMETIQLVLQPLLVVLVLQKLPTALAVVSVQTALNMSLIAARIYYCFNELHMIIKFHYWDQALFNDLKKLALSIFVVSLIDQIFFRTNQVILGVVSGTAAVAVYSVASLIYMNYMSLSTAISGVYLPHITELVAKNAPIQQLSQLFLRIGRLQYFLLALVASGFIIFGREFIALWAGESFADAYLITLLIILPFTVDLIQNLGLAILQAQNKYDFRAKVFFVMGIFNLCLAIPLAQTYGGIGCAFATGLAMFLGNGLLMNWYYLRVTRLDIGRFWCEIGQITAWVAALTAAGYWTNAFISLEGKIYLAVKILVYTVFYLCMVYKLCLNKEEREKADAVIAKFKQ